MRLHVAGTTYEGRVVDLRGRAVSGLAVAAGVREQRCLPAVEATPTPVYDYCGFVHTEMGLRTRTALATAARSLGLETKYDDEIESVRTALADLEPSEPTLPTRREPVTASTVAELRETAATQRGRLQARKRLDAETDEVANEIKETTRRLAERETERTAVEENRQRRREQAREYRDQATRRRRLADRLANRRRDARAALVKAVTERFEASVEAVPGPTPTEPFDASAVTAALAILRVARTPAPVVLTVDRFVTPAAAAETLDAPIVRC